MNKFENIKTIYFVYARIDAGPLSRDILIDDYLAKQIIY